MNQSHLGLSWPILLTNTMTMIITITAAIRRLIWSYKVIGIVAIYAFIAALHQAMTAQFTPAALLFTALLVLLITIRVLLNLLMLQERGKR